MHNRISSAIACFALILFSIVANAQQNYVDMTVRNLTITGSCTKTGAGSNSCGNTGPTGPPGPAGPTSFVATAPINLTNNTTDGSGNVSNVNVNGVYNVKAYGAEGDGSTDDEPAIQAAYNAACAAIQSSEATPSMYLPTGVYRITSPLAFGCANAQPLVYGAGNHNTIINAAFTGAAIIGSTAATFPSYNTVTVTNSVISGNSCTSCSLTYGTSATGFQDLNETLGLDGSVPQQGPFNGLAAFDIQGHLTDADVTAQQCVWASDGALNVKAFESPNNSLTAAYGIMGYLCVGSNAKLYGALNVGGTMTYLNSGSTTLTGSTEYEVELNYDNATGNANLYLGNSTVTRVAQNTGLSGTIVQRPDENNTFGLDLSTWPYIGVAGVWEGALQSFRFSKTTRNTASSYSEDTGAYTPDSNTLWLEKNDLTQFPITVGSKTAPIIEVNLGASGVGYQTWRDNGSGCCTGTLQLRDLAETGSATWGVLANAVILDEDHVNTKGSIVGSFTAANSTFFSSIKNGSTGDAGLAPIMMLGGIGQVKNEVLGVGGFSAVLSGYSQYDHLFFETNTRNICGLTFVSDGTIDADEINFDSEGNGDVNFPAFCIQNYTSPITIRESLLEPEGALGAAVKIYGNIGKLTLDSNAIAIPIGPGPSALIDASQATLNAGSSRAVLTRNRYNSSPLLPSGVSYTNGGLPFDSGRCVDPLQQLDHASVTVFESRSGSHQLLFVPLFSDVARESSGGQHHPRPD